MGLSNCQRILVCLACAGAVAGFAGAPAAAQQASLILPTLVVTASRLGFGITGAATTVISAEEVERAPGQTVQDVLANQPGIQVQNLFGAVAGARSAVDMRGFGATASSNTLVLLNGRRLNDIDIAGIDLAAIPKNAIERIEITRGNSGAVLYGDGAVGGVINIVTKSGVGVPPAARVEASGGSYGYREGRVSANRSFGAVTVSAHGNAIDSDGYRLNNALRQRNAVGEIRYTGAEGGAYLTVSADDQQLGLPGGRRVTPFSSELVTDRRGTSTPFDFADKQGLSATAGVTRMLMPGMELIVDGGIRRKRQQAGFFSSTGDPFNHVDATLTTLSFTPRLIVDMPLLGLPSKVIAGFDLYHSDYDSDRSLQRGLAPIHRYDLTQRTIGAYWQQTVAVRADTDVSLGARLQHNRVTARDRFDPSAPGGAFDLPGAPLDMSETQHALHAGLEQRVNAATTLFARAGRSFRLPNVDERIGQGFPTNFALRTQTSHDFEGGVRLQSGPLFVQASGYLMELKNEIQFSPATFSNINLDPTRRYGAEALATYRVSEALRLKGGLAYTRAVFRAGPFAGNDVPLVSRWTASAGATWNVWREWLVLDVTARLVGRRRMDNDQVNVQPFIPAHAIVDIGIGGRVDNAYWSLTVQNLFDVKYFDYAIASAFSLGTYNAYPQPGRTILARAGLVF